MLRETYLSGETIYDGAVVHLERWQVSLPNGGTAAREVVKHIGAAAVVPIDADGYITLVRQHRVAIDEMTWEIPAGKLDQPDEDPLLCAKRELEEETGLNAEHWRLLNRVITTPGFCTERISIYLATGLSQHAAHTDPDEFLFTKRIPFADALKMVDRGELTDQKTAVGILMAARVLSGEADR
ncbi:MAG: NUDIX hydrolase [Clostridia bacterium]|nr:NUDIX hydrolase [Clostridia bacterium]